jgi:hypothetical protein
VPSASRRRLLLGNRPFQPSSLPNLVFWLSADNLGLADGTAISTWTDRSGNGHNATGTTTTRPLYKSSGLSAGRPSVRFDGVDDVLLLGDLSSFFPAAATVFVAYGLNTDTNYAVYDTAGLGGGNLGFWRWSGDGNGYYCVFRSARLATYPLAAPTTGNHVTTIRSSSSAYEARLEGVSKGVQAAAYSAGANHRIGDVGSGGGASLDGDVFEIFAYSDAKTDAEIIKCERYLGSRWGISVA